MRSARFFLLPLIALLIAALLFTRDPSPSPRVVVYTSVDQVHARRLFMEFASLTGIDVEGVFDIEAQKTTGLFNRIRDEADFPVADVFWNSEASRTEQLKREGLLQAYPSPSAEDIPIELRDPEGTWHGFAARARVIVYHKDRMRGRDLPRSILDLTRPEFKGELGVANPLFGTTASHVAALFALEGRAGGGVFDAEGFLRDLRENAVILAGNSTVRDLVARGSLSVGLTDTDDVWVGLERGDPIGMIYPDADGIGTLVIPNTVALLRGARHPEEGKAFIDYLLSRDAEAFLADGPSRQIPVRQGVPVPEGVRPISEIRGMEVTVGEIVDAMDESQAFVRDEFRLR